MKRWIVYLFIFWCVQNVYSDATFAATEVKGALASASGRAAVGQLASERERASRAKSQFAMNLEERYKNLQEGEMVEMIGRYAEQVYVGERDINDLITAIEEADLPGLQKGDLKDIIREKYLPRLTPDINDANSTLNSALLNWLITQPKYIRPLWELKICRHWVPHENWYIKELGPINGSLSWETSAPERLDQFKNLLTQMRTQRIKKNPVIAYIGVIYLVGEQYKFDGAHIPIVFLSGKYDSASDDKRNKAELDNIATMIPRGFRLVQIGDIYMNFRGFDPVSAPQLFREKVNAEFSEHLLSVLPWAKRTLRAPFRGESNHTEAEQAYILACAVGHDLIKMAVNNLKKRIPEGAVVTHIVHGLLSKLPSCTYTHAVLPSINSPRSVGCTETMAYLSTGGSYNFNQAMLALFAPGDQRYTIANDLRQMFVYSSVRAYPRMYGKDIEEILEQRMRTIGQGDLSSGIVSLYGQPGYLFHQYPLTIKPAEYLNN